LIFRKSLAVSGGLAYKEIENLVDKSRRKSNDMKILLTAILILCAATAYAQTKRFRWATGLCEFEGTYDAKKYTDAQLRDTVKLIERIGYIPLFTEFTVWKFEDIKKLDVAALDREYETKRKMLENLNIVRSEYWESIRMRQLKELNQFYKLARLTLLGYNEPARLKEAAPLAESCVSRYADPLIKGGDTLLAIWREVNEESRRNNGDPERVKKIFEAEYDSPDRLKFARIEVMMFGFWNCVNQFVESEEADGTHQEKFEKLFKHVRTIVCDEP
jgi:hypothetical protein